MKPIPHLPDLVGETKKMTPSWTRQWRDECGPNYFQACLEYAQYLWLKKLPAQAILQLNKSFMASIPEHSYEKLPYRSVLYILTNSSDSGFLGNPVRHFQHLASRMPTNAYQSELRTWRAWACFCIAVKTLCPKSFPSDVRQIETEKLIIPEPSEVLLKLQQIGLASEWRIVADILEA